MSGLAVKPCGLLSIVMRKISIDNSRFITTYVYGVNLKS